MSIRCCYLITVCVSTSKFLLYRERWKQSCTPLSICDLCLSYRSETGIAFSAQHFQHRGTSRLCTIFCITGCFKSPCLNILTRVVTSEKFQSDVRREEVGRERLLLLGDKRYFCSSKPCCLVRNSYRALIFITFYQSVMLKLISVKRINLGYSQPSAWNSSFSKSVKTQTRNSCFLQNFTTSNPAAWKQFCTWRWNISYLQTEFLTSETPD